MRTVVILVLVLALIAAVSAITVYSSIDHEPVAKRPPAPPPVAPVTSDATIEKFCSTCHVLPTPDVEPKSHWPRKIDEMFAYLESGKAWPAVEAPLPIDAKAYWVARAPVELAMPPDWIGSPPSPLAFEKHLLAWDGIPSPPAISSARFVQLAEGAPVQLLVCDMRHGIVAICTPGQPQPVFQELARIPHPSHTTVVDLDRDGIRDILVANLGVFLNIDTTLGSVVWLRGRGDGSFQTVTLADGLGRVNDIEAADFDGDGDLDLVVGVFGNFFTGSIVYMENFTEDYAEPDFQPWVIDGHTGTSDVPSVDLNGDGRLDFIALQAQQHEHVLAFLNQGRGNFACEEIWAAPHPRWGSTGIKLVDMDGDGDVDVLLNHGDAFQVPPIPRPYHGVSWLENPGSFPWIYHRLAYLPGATTAQTADLDGDGRRDIVSSAFIPLFNPDWPNAELVESIIWLRQDSEGQYQRFALEQQTPFHACLDLGDYDGDGDVDIVLGNFLMSPTQDELAPYGLTVLENLSREPAPMSAANHN